jgi:chromosome segregation protein
MQWELSKSIANYEIKIEKISANRSECSSALEKHRINYAELVDELNTIQGQYYSVGSDVTRIEQSIQYARDKASEIEKDLEEIEQNLTENEEHLSLDKKTKNTLEIELKKIQPMLEEARSKEISSELLLQEAEIQMKNCQLHWDDFIKNSSGPAQQAEIQQSRIDYLEQLINRQDEKIVNLSNESEGLVREPFESDLADLKLRISKIDLLIDRKRN